jgi:hypothetical protein
LFNALEGWRSGDEDFPWLVGTSPLGDLFGVGDSVFGGFVSLGAERAGGALYK